MATDTAFGSQRIEVEADWSLRELLTVCTTYEQLYSVLYPLQPELQESLRGEGIARLEYLYRAFPWRGGYSAVNFYNSQRYLIPRDNRPSIRRIRIESPGFIELGIAVVTAATVYRVVKALTGSVGEATRLYHDIRVQMQERKLMQINVKREELALAREQLAFAEDAQKLLADGLGLAHEGGIIRALADNPLAALKITLSIYRRAAILSKAEGLGELELAQPVRDRGEQHE